MGNKPFRGGCWSNDSGLLSSSFRLVDIPAFEDSYIGFRVVKEVEPLSRVCRGGSSGNTAVNCRSAIRFGYLPSHRDSYLGFRVVKGVTNGQ